MTDVLLVAVLIVFFAIAVAFVRACERIIGPDVEAESTRVSGTPEQTAA